MRVQCKILTESMRGGLEMALPSACGIITETRVVMCYNCHRYCVSAQFAASATAALTAATDAARMIDDRSAGSRRKIRATDAATKAQVHVLRRSLRILSTVFAAQATALMSVAHAKLSQIKSRIDDDGLVRRTSNMWRTLTIAMLCVQHRHADWTRYSILLSALLQQSMRPISSIDSLMVRTPEWTAWLCLRLRLRSGTGEL